MEVCNIVREVVTKIIPKKNKCEKEKGLPEEALKTAEKIRDVKGKGEGKDIPNGIARGYKKVFISEHCKN